MNRKTTRGSNENHILAFAIAKNNSNMAMTDNEKIKRKTDQPDTW